MTSPIPIIRFEPCLKKMEFNVFEVFPRDVFAVRTRTSNVIINYALLSECK
jgi:hypothetical protein